MITTDGLTAVAAWVGMQLDGAELLVSDGTVEARAMLSQSPAIAGAVVTLTAIFGEGEANFDWRRRGVVIGGLLIDAEDGDYGRKAAGSVWTLEIPIEVTA